MIPSVERNSILIHALYDYRKKCQVLSGHHRELGNADMHEYFEAQAAWVLEIVTYFENSRAEIIMDYTSNERRNYALETLKSTGEKVKSGFPEPVTLPAYSN